MDSDIFAQGRLPVPPFELTPTVWKKTFIGSEIQIKRILKKAERFGLKFRIAWAGDAKFSPESVTSSLTERQRKTLAVAYQKGYYDVPRRIQSERLADFLGLSKSTVSEHLRKAERSILDQLTIE